jgi:hypothetical protein
MTNAQAIHSRLKLQGFACDSDPGIVAAARWLRFTPILSTLWIMVGVAARSPLVLWGFAIITVIGAAGWHPFDALFNALVRRWVNAPSLPPNPVPRRFAMAVAAVWGAGAGWLMSAGFIWIGVVVGTGLALAGVIVATTHFCLGSWMYQRFWGRTLPKVAA